MSPRGVSLLALALFVSSCEAKSAAPTTTSSGTVATQTSEPERSGDEVAAREAAAPSRQHALSFPDRDALLVHARELAQCPAPAPETVELRLMMGRAGTCGSRVEGLFDLVFRDVREIHNRALEVKPYNQYIDRDQLLPKVRGLLAACSNLAKAIEANPLAIDGCLLTADIKTASGGAAGGLGSRSDLLPLFDAYKIVVVDAWSRAREGRTEEAARLLARLIRTLAVFSRGDNAIMWGAMKTPANDWIGLIDGWLPSVTPATRQAVLLDVKAAISAIRPASALARASLLDSFTTVEESERGTDGALIGGAAILSAFRELDGGKDLATLNAEDDAEVAANDALIRALNESGKRTVSALTEEERRILLVQTRRVILAGLGYALSDLEKARAALQAFVTRWEAPL